MRRRSRLSRQSGYLFVDVIVALGLFSFVLLAIYHIYGPTIALYQGVDSRLSAQQDVRLALDRVARALHETSTAYGRLRVYPPEAGCAGAYDACIGFVTARDGDCTGTFQMIDGRANWQATLYLWRDTVSNEMRLHCNTTTTFPVTRWPPPTLEGASVIGRRIVAASVTIRAAGGSRPAAIAIALQEQAQSGRRNQVNLFNETVFLPQNR